MSVVTRRQLVGNAGHRSIQADEADETERL
jgi:hypothetical protein